MCAAGTGQGRPRAFEPPLWLPSVNYVSEKRRARRDGRGGGRGEGVMAVSTRQMRVCLLDFIPQRGRKTGRPPACMECMDHRRRRMAGWMGGGGPRTSPSPSSPRLALSPPPPPRVPITKLIPGGVHYLYTRGGGSTSGHVVAGRGGAAFIAAARAAETEPRTAAFSGLGAP